MTERIPIAIFLPSLRGGGAQRVVVDLANGLAEEGERVYLILATDDQAYAHLVSPHVRIQVLGVARVASAIFPLARWLKEADPRCLLAVQRNAVVAAYAAKIASRWQGIFLARETNSFSVALDRHRSTQDRIVDLLVRQVYQRLDCVIAPSMGVASDLVGCGRVVVIPNPVKVPSGHGLKRERKFFLAVGRLDVQKRFGDLLRAFALLKQRIGIYAPDLIILGEGPQRRQLLDLAEGLGIADCVELPGFDADPFPYMRSAAAVVVSSGWEGLPNVLIQGLACGCPVVSTDCPHGPREILDGGRWGTLVPVGDVDALAGALECVLRGGRTSCAPEALAPYDPARVVSQYRALMDGSLSPKRRYTRFHHRSGE